MYRQSTECLVKCVYRSKQIRWDDRTQSYIEMTSYINWVITDCVLLIKYPKNYFKLAKYWIFMTPFFDHIQRTIKPILHATCWLLEVISMIVYRFWGYILKICLEWLWIQGMFPEMEPLLDRTESMCWGHGLVLGCCVRGVCMDVIIDFDKKIVSSRLSRI